MKRLAVLKCLLATGAVVALIPSAQADLSFNFDTDLSGFTGPVAWTAGPAGWSGGAALQATFATPGWTGLTITKDFDWASGEQTAMQEMLATGNGMASFDVLVDNSSFTPAMSDWFEIDVAGNSESGWTQSALTLVTGWHTAGDTALYATHIDMTFAQLGWVPGTSTWFQINFGANSGTSPVNFYVDNLAITAVPEPAFFALAGLSAAALLIIRRRKA
ncbi:MAG: PEP-CTERM sorting domain-containing protein [Verrucomicrobiia bacterium]